MARKPALNAQALAALGVERLAQLVLDEAGSNAAFRKIVNAALAGRKGPNAVAALIDRRLAALERARGFIDWEKTRDFAADLEATVKTIVQELGALDAGQAVERLLRFIATQESVLERIGDSGARIENVYDSAVDELSPLAARMSEADRNRLPDMAMAALGTSNYGSLQYAAEAFAGHIPAAALEAWDRQLAERAKAMPPSPRGWETEVRTRDAIAARQAIAEARGDLDGLIALEKTKPERARNTLELARRLLAAGRTEEALDWVRRGRRGPAGSTDNGAIEDDIDLLFLRSDDRVSLEASILEALGRKPEAQALRWSTFEATLEADILREHVDRLDDFAEFEVVDRALDLASRSPHAYGALRFFLAWPRLDRAAALVMARAGQWDGRHYELLAPAAQALEADHPVAAALIYRALLDDILTRARSPAYGHGARHLDRLAALAPALAAAAVPGMESHADYRARIAKAHGRKTAFWSQVRGGKP